MTGAEMLLSAALLAAAAAEEAAGAPDPAQDQRLVDACNARAAEAVLDRASVLLCGAAYERLLDHHGGYRAYRAARERRRTEQGARPGAGRGGARLRARRSGPDGD